MNRITLPEIRHIKGDIYNLFPVYGKKYTIARRNQKNDNVLESKKIVTAIYLGKNEDEDKFKFYRINKCNNVEQYSSDINERVFWYFDENTPNSKIEYLTIWTNRNKIYLSQYQNEFIKKTIKEKLEEIIIDNKINQVELLLL